MAVPATEGTRALEPAVAIDEQPAPAAPDLVLVEPATPATDAGARSLVPAHRGARAVAPAIAVRAVSSPLARGGSVDLLAPLGRGRRHLPALLFSARVLNMVVMVALIAIGIGVASDAVALTNLTSLLVWNVWWPFLVLAVL